MVWHCESVVSSAPSLPLRTDRLLLRAYAPEDIAATLDYYANSEVSRFLLSEPFTPEDAIQAVEQRSGWTDPTKVGESLALVAEHKGRLVGDVTLKIVGEQCSIGEVGWCFHPKYTGRGFATEAASALLVLAFEHFRMHRVTAQMDARNIDSARLCERLGMTKEAHLRQDWWSKGEWTDTYVYAMLADDRVPH